MKRWWVFYTTVLIAILLNGYFGVYKEIWLYAEQINLFGIIVLIGANTLILFSHWNSFLLLHKNKKNRYTITV